LCSQPLDGQDAGSDHAAKLPPEAFKPTATIASPQQTVTRSDEATALHAKGRHDLCVLPRAVPMVEAAVLLLLPDHWLRQRAMRA
jgi:chorismate synthase